MSEDKKRKKKKKAGDIFLTIVLIAAICIFCYAAYNLYHIYTEYKKGSDEYNAIAQMAVIRIRTVPVKVRKQQDQTDPL